MGVIGCWCMSSWPMVVCRSTSILLEVMRSLKLSFLLSFLIVEILWSPLWDVHFCWLFTDVTAVVLLDLYGVLSILLWCCITTHLILFLTYRITLSFSSIWFRVSLFICNSVVCLFVSHHVFVAINKKQSLFSFLSMLCCNWKNVIMVSNISWGYYVFISSSCLWLRLIACLTFKNAKNLS